MSRWQRRGVRTGISTRKPITRPSVDDLIFSLPSVDHFTQFFERHHIRVRWLRWIIQLRGRWRCRQLPGGDGKALLNIAGEVVQDVDCLVPEMPAGPCSSRGEVKARFNSVVEDKHIIRADSKLSHVFGKLRRWGQHHRIFGTGVSDDIEVEKAFLISELDQKCQKAGISSYTEPGTWQDSNDGSAEAFPAATGVTRIFSEGFDKALCSSAGETNGDEKAIVKNRT